MLHGGEPMNTKRHNVARLLSLIVILLSCAFVNGAGAENSPSLNKKELKTLEASAKTPADHQRLAEYYQDKAQRLRAKSQEFAVQADYLATQPATIESKQGISCNCVSHYRYFSKLYAQEAKDSEKLAAQHDQFAREAAAKPAAQK